MELTIVQPLKVRMPAGPQTFEPGQVIKLPDKVGLRLMELAPGKVRRMEDSPFSIGQLVQYQYPVDIKSATNYSWKECIGVVEMIDHKSHLALIIPKNETIPWRWVNLVFVNGGLE